MIEKRGMVFVIISSSLYMGKSALEANGSGMPPWKIIMIMQIVITKGKESFINNLDGLFMSLCNLTKGKFYGELKLFTRRTLHIF